MLFKSIKNFQLVLDGPDDAVYTSGEVITGQVVLELNRDIKVRSMRVLGRGVATAHWLENRSVGMNTVYNDYTSKMTYFRKRQHLIRGNVSLRVHTRTRVHMQSFFDIQTSLRFNIEKQVFFWDRIFYCLDFCPHYAPCAWITHHPTFFRKAHVCTCEKLELESRAGRQT